MIFDSKDNIKILVVDDEPSILEIITFMLENEGYIVSNAATGFTALEKVLTFKPNLILLDVMLPKMDGIEVARRLKSNFRTRHIPIIMVSAKRDIEDKIIGMEIGADDYVTKPFSRDELLARVKMVLRRTKEQLERNALTSLPGNIFIEIEIKKLIEQKKRFSMFYLDMDNFKPFNDYYGYVEGDKAIILLGNVLLDVIEEFGSSEDIVGHIGGDDFVVLTFTEDVDILAGEMVSRFYEKSKGLFPEEDMARGYFVTEDRQHKKSSFRTVLTISVVIIEDVNGRFTNYAQLVDSAMELKKYAKSLGGNRFVKERRSETRI
ncbi:MAG: GGDEF domain-containing response regulator [bacterium]